MPGPLPREREDDGLRGAIAAAGGVTALAKKLGIAAQSIIKWRRVPVARVRAVEEITGIDRAVLRPDLYER